ncbi:hypothetical protein [Nitrososphaera sp.]|uniref:hypothetical protein n=1 Tax=Nitrososphaera sp. TaxID=1971748 RepID=UPI00307CD25E
MANLDLSQQIPLPANIPTEPEAFYRDFGPLRHPATRKPVLQLAPYQYDTWRKFLKHRRLLEVKSHRVGESSKWMLVDFHLAVLPSSNPLSTRGYDTMLLGPTKQQAIEILRDFRRRVLESRKYSPFIMDRPEEIDLLNDSISSGAVLRDEKSKTAALYIKNPESPLRPSRIIALGADNPGLLEGWPNFKHIHVTDITAARRDYKEALEIALTRIANTDGTAVIETIPGKPYGQVYEWAQRYRGIPESELKKGDFCYVEVTAEQAVAAGVMPGDFLEGERRRLTTADFNGLYGASFTSTTGNVFSSQAIERAIELGKKYNPEEIHHSAEKSQGIDEGFGSSMFGVVVVQKVDGLLVVTLAEEYERPDINKMAYEASQRIKTWPIETTQCDAAQPAFIKLLKTKVGENPDYASIPKEKHRFMRVKPITFGTEHREMLGNTALLVEKGWVAIHPNFAKLITALRTAVAEDYSLDKEATLHNDVLDAFRLALRPYAIKGRG